MITLEVLGTPAPKGSSRAFVNKATGRAIVAPSGSAANKIKIASWNVAVRQAALEALERHGCREVMAFVKIALKVAIVFRVSRPAGHYSKATGQLLASAPAFPSSKPDIDKLARTTLDAMTGSIFDDDSRIASLHLDKVFAAPGHEGATIRVESLDACLKAVEDEIARARKVGDLFAEVTRP